MSDSSKVHGLDGTWVEPDWPPLTLDELSNLLKDYPQSGKLVEIRFASPRPLSAAAVVNTLCGGLFVKRHARKVRDRAGLLEEHRFMTHLHARGASVPRVRVNASGESAVEIGEFTYEVHEVASGVDTYGGAISWTPFACAAHAREAGKALAQLHLIAEGFDAPQRKAQPLIASFTIFSAQDALAALNHYLRARPAIADDAGLRNCANEALDILEPYFTELRPLLRHLMPLWTHNDLHASNLMWSDPTENASVASVIDFSLSDCTNAVHDLANAIERNIVEWLALVQNPDKPEEVPIHFDHLEALLAGYESVRPLSREEALALLPMTALCHAEFALSEAEYFLGVLHSESSARMAYDGYLLGHARWFATRRGHALLATLRRWADKHTCLSQKTGGS